MAWWVASHSDQLLHEPTRPGDDTYGKRQTATLGNGVITDLLRSWGARVRSTSLQIFLKKLPPTPGRHPILTRAAVITFFGTFGAVIKIKSPITSRKALFDIGIAGPLAGFALALPASVIGLWVAEASPASALEPGSMLFQDPPLFQLLNSLLNVPPLINWNPVYWAAWGALLVTALNLFPVGQLDGGHVLYAVAGRRVHKWLSLVTALGSRAPGHSLAHHSRLANLVSLDRSPVVSDESAHLHDRRGTPGRPRLAGPSWPHSFSSLLHAVFQSPSIVSCASRMSICYGAPLASKWDYGRQVPLQLSPSGFVYGLRHALDPDHMVAVSTIVSEHNSLARSSLIGTFWGLGPTTSL